MKVLVACEESQAVTKELRAIGVEAYSCDIERPTGGRREWHCQVDVKLLLEKDWDMIIAFPPCTHLANSGAVWFEGKVKSGVQKAAIEFFMLFVNCKCKRVAIENPVGIMSTIYRPADQIIQPYLFGDPFMKTTCLWLKNLPPLEPTNIVKPGGFTYFPSGKRMSNWFSNAWPADGREGRSRARSKTFAGIAKAMANQWGRIPITTVKAQKPDLFSGLKTPTPSINFS